MKKMATVRKKYSVPAKRGMKIVFSPPYSEVREGIITSSDGKYIGVRFHGEKKIKYIHPTWQVQYIEKKGGAK